MPMPRLCGGMLLIGRPAEADLAVGRGLEAGEHHQAGGLARAGRPEHGEELALADVEVEVFDHQGLAVVALLHVLESHEGRVAAFDRHACFPVGFRASRPVCADDNHIAADRRKSPAGERDAADGSGSPTMRTAIRIIGASLPNRTAERNRQIVRRGGDRRGYGASVRRLRFAGRSNLVIAGRARAGRRALASSTRCSTARRCGPPMPDCSTGSRGPRPRCWRRRRRRPRRCSGASASPSRSMARAATPSG